MGVCTICERRVAIDAVLIGLIELQRIEREVRTAPGLVDVELEFVKARARSRVPILIHDLKTAQRQRMGKDRPFFIAVIGERKFSVGIETVLGTIGLKAREGRKFSGSGG